MFDKRISWYRFENTTNNIVQQSHRLHSATFSFELRRSLQWRIKLGGLGGLACFCTPLFSLQPCWALRALFWRRQLPSTCRKKRGYRIAPVHAPDGSDAPTTNFHA